MVAFIIGGYDRGTEARTLYELLTSTTDVYYLNHSTHIFHDVLLTDNALIDIMPWLFDFDEPWKAPVHYPPAKNKITGRSAVIKNYLTTRKQPRARAGFRRGQRRIKR